jgi:hypothetical protein
MTKDLSTPAVYGNNSFIVGMVKFSGVMTLLMALGFFFAGIVKVLHASEPMLHKTAGLFGVTIAGFFTVGLGRYMWEQGNRMAFYQVGLENKGLRVRLGTKDNPQEQFLAWDQVAAVKYWRVANVQYGSVVGKAENFVEWSSYTFFRPKKVARLIAARAGQSVQEI